MPQKEGGDRRDTATHARWRNAARCPDGEGLPRRGRRRWRQRGTGRGNWRTRRSRCVHSVQCVPRARAATTTAGTTTTPTHTVAPGDRGTTGAMVFHGCCGGRRWRTRGVCGVCMSTIVALVSASVWVAGQCVHVRVRCVLPVVLQAAAVASSGLTWPHPYCARGVCALDTHNATPHPTPTPTVHRPPHPHTPPRPPPTPRHAATTPAAPPGSACLEAACGGGAAGAARAAGEAAAHHS